MVSYAASERRLAVAIKDLHAYVWTGRRADEAELLARLVRGARDLDRHLGTRHRIERSVRAMTRRFRKGAEGVDLFTFLQATAGLSYAADRVRRQPREAARAASELAVSLTVHLASAAGADRLVARFESGRADFDDFTDGLHDALESRGVLRAAEFDRAANLAFDIHALWSPKHPPAVRRVMASASLASAGFACVVFVDALRSLGRYRETPYARLVPVVAAVLGRRGGQA